MSPVVWLPLRLRLNAIELELEAQRRRAPVSMLVGLAPTRSERKPHASVHRLNMTVKDKGK
jgi:hypothetical protein